MAMDPAVLEQLVLKATNDAIRNLLSSPETGLHRAVSEATSQVLRDTRVHAQHSAVPSRLVPPSTPIPAVSQVSKQPAPRFQLQLCDDEKCVFEDVVNGAIMAKLITKKVVRLRFEESPKSVMVVKKLNDRGASAMFDELVPWLHDKGLQVVVEPTVFAETVSKYPFLRTWTPEQLQNLHTCIHFVISLGGDGTLLWAQSLFLHGPVPVIMSYAAGSLGFLTSFDFSGHRAIIANFLAHGGFITLRTRLTVELYRNLTDKPVFLSTALNEALLDRGPSPYLTKLDCYCDGHYTTTVQADGVIIATPTGSTAYSLAAGGSMVHPLVPGILFTPVCPHSLSFRPMIFPDSAVLKIKVPSSSRSTAWLTVDGRSRVELCPGDFITVRTSLWPVPVLCKTDETSDWFQSVTEILHWNERKAQKPTL
jgi:NAD+ kinase